MRTVVALCCLYCLGIHVREYQGCNSCTLYFNSCKINKYKLWQNYKCYLNNSSSFVHEVRFWHKQSMFHPLRLTSLFYKAMEKLPINTDQCGKNCEYPVIIAWQTGRLHCSNTDDKCIVPKSCYSHFCESINFVLLLLTFPLLKLCILPKIIKKIYIAGVWIIAIFNMGAARVTNRSFLFRQGNDCKA